MLTAFVALLIGLTGALLIALGVIIILVRANTKMGAAFVALEERHKECRHALAARHRNQGGD